MKVKLDLDLYCYTRASSLVGRLNFGVKQEYLFSTDYMVKQIVEYIKLFNSK